MHVEILRQRPITDRGRPAVYLSPDRLRAAAGTLRSRAVAEQLGMRMEGNLRDAQWLYDHHVDHAVYGLLAEDSLIP